MKDFFSKDQFAEDDGSDDDHVDVDAFDPEGDLDAALGGELSDDGLDTATCPPPPRRL